MKPNERIHVEEVALAVALELFAKDDSASSRVVAAVTRLIDAKLSESAAGRREPAPKDIDEMFAAIERLGGEQNFTLSRTGSTITIRYDEPEREAEPGGGDCHDAPSESLTWQWCPECGAFSEEGEPWRKPSLWARLLGRAARFESECAGEKVLRQKAEVEFAAAKGRILELEEKVAYQDRVAQALAR